MTFGSSDNHKRVLNIKGIAPLGEGYSGNRVGSPQIPILCKVNAMANTSMN